MLGGAPFTPESPPVIPGHVLFQNSSTNNSQTPHLESVPNTEVVHVNNITRVTIHTPCGASSSVLCSQSRHGTDSVYTTVLKHKEVF